MDYFPLFLAIRSCPCLVVGGGAVAARKVALLLKADARVIVVSPQLHESLRHLKQTDKILHIEDVFNAQYLSGMVLVIAATDNQTLNQAIATQAKAQNIPVNVVNEPKSGSFIVPSIIDRAPVYIAISTGGAAPVLARLLKARLQAMIPTAYGKLAALMAEFRQTVKNRFSTVNERRIFWEQALHSPVAELLFSGRKQAAIEHLQQALDVGVIKQGEVYLVGGGPGDPDLLTFRALRLIQQADVVFYDRLVSPAILDIVRPDTERIYVGKQRDQHTVPQHDINRLLIEQAKQGKKVLRLKGGDPFIFGRGGEEIEELSAAGIPFQIVPGISAANGCASYAGIPLTHRDYAQACIFVTGHIKEGHLDLNWNLLAKPQQTIVIYMGLQGLETVSKKLIEHGAPPELPAALIEKGTTAAQKVYCSCVKDLAQLAQAMQISPPTLIIIGEVVKLREKLAWFDV